MDRNTAIGMTLMGALLLVYFYWFSPTPQPQTVPTATTELATASASTTGDSTTSTTISPQLDSAKVSALQGFGTFATGREEKVSVETQDLKVEFSTKGGVIKYLELKNYKTYFGKPLVLVEPRSNAFELSTKVNGEPLDLYTLYYGSQVSKKNDTTVVTFSLRNETGSFTQTYNIPPVGYEIGYSLKNGGLAEQLSTEQLTLNWTNILRPLEKDLADSRNNTTINSYTVAGEFDYISERSTDTETETFADPLKWISFKQKFFLASIIAKESFAGGELQTSVNQSDTSVVKRANAKLFIPLKAITDNKADFTFYFGPNDYNQLEKVTTGFNENVYLGWAPIKYINKFAIRPLFNVLVDFNMNYGLVILVLVIILRLVLLPLSYSSNLSMAKMKVLKPELDEIKEKFPDDMAKAQQEQMKLYQQVGVNPISGCIPVLLQLPILMAMFYLFPNSIELRQESLWWAEDLSSYDSILTLPFTIPFYGNHVSLFVLLMTAATLYYTWQNNQMTTVQGPMKSLGYIMPVVFIFVLNSFPAALSFYYFVSTMATIVQQIVIKRFVDEDKIRSVMDENRKKIAAGGGTKSKFMSKLENAMKASEEARKKADEAKKTKKK
jgi:YidC/Oxa1 family membrane protein insertase